MTSNGAPESPGAPPPPSAASRLADAVESDDPEDAQAQMRAIASRLGVEFPIATERLGRVAAALAAGNTTATAALDDSDDGTRTRDVDVVGRRAVAPPSLDDSVSNNESDFGMDATERGLHRALAATQAENRQLRQKLMTMHEREVQIVALSVKAQEDFQASLRQVDQLKTRVRTELMHPISEQDYATAISKPDSRRDLVDEIRIAVHQQLGALAAAKAHSLSRAAGFENSLRDTESANRSLQEAHRLLQSEYDRDIGVLKAQLELQTQRAANAEEIARNAAMTIDANQVKAARCERAEIDKAHLEQQLAHSRDNAATFEAKYSHAAAELAGAKEELQRVQVLLHGAQAEVTSLSREREALTSRNHDAEHRLARLEVALMEAQQHRVDSAHSTAAERESLRTTMERHLQTELKRYRDQYTEDLERVREGARQAAEREVASLREARDREAAEALRFKAECDEAKSALDLHRTTAQARVEQIQVQLYEARLQVATKTNEVVRLDLHLKESESAKERYQMDAECLQRKLDILKEEFYDLKSYHRDEVSRFTAKLASQEEQLELMKDMEAEAEVYLANAARHDAAGGDASGLLVDIPASRRITNAISVTRKALALENQVELLKHDRGVAEAKLLKVRAELDMAKEALRGGNSPYALMEEALIRKDREMERLHATEQTLRSEVSVLEEKLRVALQDVRVLQGHRAELVRIRAYLEQLQNQPLFKAAAQHAVMASVSGTTAAERAGGGIADKLPAPSPTRAPLQPAAANASAVSLQRMGVSFVGAAIEL